MLYALVLAAFLALPSEVPAAEIRLSPNDRTSLDLTVYGNGLAMIRDSRSVSLSAGDNRVVLDGISRQMIPSSSRLTGGSELRTLAMDYDTDLLTPESLLQRFLGKQVEIVRTHPTTGEDSIEKAEILSVDGGVVLRYRDRIETGAPGRIIFPDIPGDLRPTPALIASIATDRPGTDALTLTYLSDGLSWRADYAIVLDEKQSTLTVEGRALVTNASGVDFQDASLSLVAGAVNRISTAPGPIPKARGMAAAIAEVSAQGAAIPERQVFGDLHLYRIDRPVTLAEQESKLVSLTHAADVPYKRLYVSTDNPFIVTHRVGGVRFSHPEVQITFENAKGSPAGEPLPAGIARVYTLDDGGFLRLLGEDQLDNTAAGEDVELAPGQAFDITVERTQTDFVRAGLAEGTYETAHEITVRNAKSVPASVRVVETMSGDWSIVKESAPHKKPTANEAEWTVDVPAGGSATIAYRVRVQR